MDITHLRVNGRVGVRVRFWVRVIGRVRGRIRVRDSVGIALQHGAWLGLQLTNATCPLRWGRVGNGPKAEP